MPYVYRYRDMIDEKYKYIGIVKQDGMERLQRRIKQHRKDDWFKTADYYVDYVQVDSLCDAESLEGHFIATYETYKYYNIAKARWGKSSLYSSVDLTWREYGIESAHAIYEEQSKKLSARVNKLIDKKQEVEIELKKMAPYTVVDYDNVAHISFDVIREDLFEKINLYEDWASNSETKTSRHKWAYRANKLRSAVYIMESAIFDRVSYPYSKEYQEDQLLKGGFSA